MIMKKHFSTGYTLIELVVVAAILGIIGVVSVSLFLTSLSGGGKSSGTNEVRANGDYAITQMERMIRNAIRINGACTEDMSSLSILNADGNTTTFSLLNGRIASNSGYITAQSSQVSGAIDFDCSQPIDGSPGIVTVTFLLSKANALTNRFENVEVEFSTSVQLRTY
jgi:prepilin-type N-terminal cleavage/methylation domain-containing protein